MANKRIVFLDIDGCLNTRSSRTRCNGCVGIDSNKLELLKIIVIATGAEVVLTSTWKTNWERLPERKHLQDIYATYLDKKFKSAGLKVADKTANCRDGVWFSRGESILDFVDKHQPRDFVILDDKSFDYDGCGLTDNFIKLDEKVGLTNERVEQAIKILKKR